MNKVILIGRITKDIELRKTQNGTSVVQYTLAVNRPIKKDGQPEADFINCVAWSKTADIMEKYLQKGSMIAISGQIQTRSYEDQQGKRIYVTEVLTDNVQFLEPKSATEPQDEQSNTNIYQGNNTRYEQPSLTQQAEQQAFADTLDIASDDLPF